MFPTSKLFQILIFQILILPRLGPRPCRAVPPSGRAPALAKLKFAKFFERTNDETELQESYRPKKLCTWSKFGQGIRFSRQKSPSSSKIHRKWRKTSFRHRKISSIFFFFASKTRLGCCVAGCWGGGHVKWCHEVAKPRRNGSGKIPATATIFENHNFLSFSKF